MAPIHRMEGYHDIQPAPIPVKLKPKSLKKLAAQSKGPVFVLVPAPPPLPNFTPNFATVAKINAPQVSDAVLLDHQQRFRAERKARPKVQQLQFRPSTHDKWTRHLISEQEEDEQEQEVQEETRKRSSQFSAMKEVHLSSRVASMTIADVSPRFALKKILMLCENNRYRESASFVNRLSSSTFGVIISDLPVDLFIDSMPHSLPIIETLYAKVFLSDGHLTRNSLNFLRPEAVVWQMVKFFANQDNSVSLAQQNWRWDYCGPFISSCKKLLRVIVLSEPKIRKNLQQRRKVLDKAIEGLGQHGLVGTSDEDLMNLHDALKVEFNRVVHSYKEALAKLEQLALAHKNPVVRTVSNGPAPVQASHQRQLSLRQNEIQERLIKNKTLLNVVEPTLANHSLDLFLGILQRRVELDKDVLFQITQIKKESKIDEANAVVAPVLMKYSHGCQQVLDLMREVSVDEDEEEDEDSSDVSGYHSDSDSTIMASGNSPFVSKNARYNFLSRSVRLSSKVNARASLLINTLGLETGLKAVRDHKNPRSSEDDSRSASSSGNSSTSSSKLRSTAAMSVNDLAGRDTVCQRCATHQETEKSLKNELELLKAELKKTQAQAASLQDKEKKLRERLANQAKQMADRSVGGKFETSQDAERSAALVRAYGNLYAQSRVETLEWLDKMHELRNADELKTKLLFSVVVLAFRAAQTHASQMKDHIRRILQVPPSPLLQASASQTSTQSPPPPPPPPPPSMVTTMTNRPLPPAPPPPPVARKDARRIAASDIENSVCGYLRQSVDTFDLTKQTEEVCNQIWATLYDYPCLRSCEGLIKYIKDSVRLAWSLVNQTPPYLLEYEARQFKPEFHVRFHTSDANSESIKTYLWPALVESPNGPCVHKAVVVT